VTPEGTLNPDDLALWLRRQLDVDERAAQMVDDLHLDLAEPPPADGRAMVFMSPEQYVNAAGVLSGDRIRAEVKAKRRILDRHAACGTDRGSCGGRANGSACPDVVDLAAMFEHRPGYRAEWQA
jgi:hypothetical protein